MALAWNLHTHTWRCKHAEGDVIDYARVAAKAGMHTLGISDHTPWPDGRWHHVRMSVDQLDDYFDAIDQAQAAVQDLRIIPGMECEYVPELHTWLGDELRGRRGCEYLIGAVHYIPPPAGEDQWISAYSDYDPLAYADHACQTMTSGLFNMLAHPDVFGVRNEHFDQRCSQAAHQIAATAAATGTPLELNGYGLRKPATFGRPASSMAAVLGGRC